MVLKKKQGLYQKLLLFQIQLHFLRLMEMAIHQ